MLNIGDRFGATGEFTPLETIGNDFLSNNFDVRGILSVKTINCINADCP